MKVVSLVGARPQFVKEAIISETVRAAKAWDHVLVHSGQHYDAVMSDVFFQELGIPTPRYNLGVGSGAHGAMTAAALDAMEKVLEKERPDALLVYGDTNTSLAGALAAAKMCIPVIHVEAGIRQAPRTMPEEINRRLIDHASRLLCCCSQLAADNLQRENIREGVIVCGDVMFDLFKRMEGRFDAERECAERGLVPGSFFVATLHRNFNVDDQEVLYSLLKGFSLLVRRTGKKVLLPLHPRTGKSIDFLHWGDVLQDITLISPLGYLELMSLVGASAGVLTDSGGLQKEAYYAGKRAVVLMPDTGWRELVELGWNLLCPSLEAEAVAGLGGALLETPPPMPCFVYGAGDAATRIVRHVCDSCSQF